MLLKFARWGESMKIRIVIMYFLVLSQINCLISEVYICEKHRDEFFSLENFLSKNEVRIECKNYHTTFSSSYAMETPKIGQSFFCNNLNFSKEMQENVKNNKLSYRVSISSLLNRGFMGGFPRLLWSFFKPSQNQLNVIVHLEAIDRKTSEVTYTKTKTYVWKVFLRVGVFSDHKVPDAVGNYLTSEIEEMLLTAEKDLKK
jgi:hypothetical protein